MIYQKCTNRYFKNPSPNIFSEIPQRAPATISLLSKELNLSTLKAFLEKEWQHPKSHAVCVPYLRNREDSKEAEDSEVDSEAEAVEERAIDRCAALIHLLTEKSLYVEELSIGYIDSELDQTELAEAIAKCTGLKHIEIHNGNEAIVQTLQSLPNLISIKLFSCTASNVVAQLAKGRSAAELQCLSVSGTQQFSAIELSSLSKCLREFYSLRDLRLLPDGTTDLEAESAIEIAASLHRLSSLRDVSFGNFSATTTLQLVQGLQIHETIRSVGFWSPHMDPETFVRVIQALDNYPTLKLLKLNSPLNKASARLLGNMLGKDDCCLEVLDLSECKLAFEVAQPLIRGLSTNRSLRVLTLACTEIDQQSAALLGDAIGKHSGLVELRGEFPRSWTLEVARGALASKSLLDIDLGASAWNRDAQAQESLVSLLTANTTLLSFGFPSYFRDELHEAIWRILSRNRRGIHTPDNRPASF